MGWKICKLRISDCGLNERDENRQEGQKNYAAQPPSAVYCLIVSGGV
jgi:hypothetical protein